LARIPIDTYIDHGENRETTASPNPTAPQIDMKNPPPGSSAAGYRHYVDKIGKVDVYLATHHGTALSGSPAAVNALAPVVVIMGNSARKGADAARMKTIKASPRLQGMWQLHTTTVAPDVNVPGDMIANPGTDQSKDKAYGLRLRIEKSGKVTVINERNGYNKTY